MLIFIQNINTYAHICTRILYLLSHQFLHPSLYAFIHPFIHLFTNERSLFRTPTHTHHAHARIHWLRYILLPRRQVPQANNAAGAVKLYVWICTCRCICMNTHTHTNKFICLCKSVCMHQIVLETSKILHEQVDIMSLKKTRIEAYIHTHILFLAHAYMHIHHDTRICTHIPFTICRASRRTACEKAPPWAKLTYDEVIAWRTALILFALTRTWRKEFRERKGGNKTKYRKADESHTHISHTCNQMCGTTGLVRSKAWFCCESEPTQVATLENVGEIRLEKMEQK